MICRECEKCGKCGKPYSSISNHAEICKDFEKKKQTNFEAIKNMSIEEMTVFLHNSAFSIPKGICNVVCNGFCYVKHKPECMKKIKQWLESEVVE